MTREERIKYCRCCTNRQSNPSCGLVCSLTGDPANFEDGCKDFQEDPVAMKEYFYQDDEKRESRHASIESLIVGVFVCCFLFSYFISVLGLMIDGSYKYFGQMAEVSAFFVAIGLTMIFILYMYRKFRKQKVEGELTENSMFKVVQDEGYFPHKENNGEVVFKIKGTTLILGHCANGFVYSRIYYPLKNDNNLAALISANEVELTYVSVKVLVHPDKGMLIFSVESLCQDPESFRAFFNRSLSILSDSVDMFSDKMRQMCKVDSNVEPKEEPHDAMSCQSSKHIIS